MRIKLEVLSGPLDGHIYQFNSTSDIGREGQIKLAVDPFVSRKHAIIEISGATVFLEDLASTNGTFIASTGLAAVTGGLLAAAVVKGRKASR